MPSLLRGLASAATLGTLSILLACAGQAQFKLETPAPPPPQSAPLADTDNDGIADPDDRCPKEKEDSLPPNPKDGCAAPDGDQDGVLSPADKCPAEPETVNGFEDDDGCPDTKPALAEISGLEIRLNEKIQFKTNSTQIQPVSHVLIETIANVLKANPAIDLVEIAGHADNRGSAAANKTLTLLRSKAVLAALVKLGVDARRLRAAGYGSYCPAVDGTDEAAYEANRRVQLHILVQNAKPTGVLWGGCEEALNRRMKPVPVPASPAAANATSGAQSK